jgi:hypothetical protein
VLAVKDGVSDTEEEMSSTRFGDSGGEMWVPRLPSPPPTPAPPEASLTTQERLRLAKRRRAAQLKRFAQRDVKGGNSSSAATAHPDLIQGHNLVGGASPELGVGGPVYNSSAKKAKMRAPSTSSTSPSSRVTNSNGYLVRFVANVMLLEAAARNDVEEGERVRDKAVDVSLLHDVVSDDHGGRS